MHTSSCESRTLIQSRCNWWATWTATGLVGDPSSHKSQCGGHVESTVTIFSKTKLCGEEKRNGARDVLDR